MRRKALPLLAAFLLVCSLTYSPPAYATDQCLACHSSLSDKPSTLFLQDIHHSKGLSCADCHGGNPGSDDMEKAMDKNAGFIGVPKGDSISVVCARCHASAETMKGYHSSLPTNQFEQLSGSVHGNLATNGRERIAQCTTCHGAHGIVSPKDRRSPVHPLNVVRTCAKCHSDAAYMRSYDPSLPVDQLEKYRTSVHGMRNARGDAKTAECASCHGSHDILPVKDANARVYPGKIPGTCSECHSDAQYMKGYNIPTDQFDKFAGSVHGIALLKKNDPGAPACNSCHGNHGATPPGVESISKVCGTCHALNADLFSSSPHKKAFDEKNLPECETCHGNHAIAPATSVMLGTAPDAVCSRCHTVGDHPEAYRAAGVMRTMMDSLENTEERARLLVEEAEQKGMEVGEAKFKLRDARQARLEARTMVHASDVARFSGVVEKGLKTADIVAGEGQEAIDEYYFRRIGLGVATLIITVLAVSLYVFIRRLERRQGG